MEERSFQLLNKAFMLAAVLVVGILIFFVGQMIYQQGYLNLQNQHQVTVSGEGKVYAKPDIALISLGVTAQATTVAEVTKNNTEKMNAVIKAIKDLGVDEKDIQTTNYSLTPVYENYTVPTDVSTAVPTMYPSSGSGTIMRTGTTLKGYRLEQDIQVKIRDFEKIGDIISKATAAGSNLAGGLQFTIDNPEQFRQQARAKAIAQAKSNAQNLSKESGVSLGKIINIYENYIYSRAYDSNVKLGMGGAAPEAAPAPAIEPGQQEINVTINMTYQVR